MKKIFLAVSILATTMTAYSSTLNISKYRQNVSQVTKEECSTSNKDVHSWVKWAINQKIQDGVYRHIWTLINEETNASNVQLKDNDSISISIINNGDKTKALVSFAKKLPFSVDIDGKSLDIDIIPKENKFELEIATSFSENSVYDSLGRITKDNRYMSYFYRFQIC